MDWYDQFIFKRNRYFYLELYLKLLFSVPLLKLVLPQFGKHSVTRHVMKALLELPSPELKHICCQTWLKIKMKKSVLWALG